MTLVQRSGRQAESAQSQQGIYILQMLVPKILVAVVDLNFSVQLES